MSARKIIGVVLAACLVLSAAGCGSVFSSEYYYSEPFREEDIPENENNTEVKDQQALKKAILDLVENGETEVQFRFGNYKGALLNDLAVVCHEIKTSTPIGTYAVKDISYDTSRIVSYYTATVRIDYKRSRDEIAAVEDISGLAELQKHIVKLLGSHTAESVIKIYSSSASEEYITGLIYESYYSDPLLVAELPEFTVEAFPDNGPERIYSIEFKYSVPDTRLSEMREELQNRVAELAQQAEGTDALSLALDCARMLNEKSAGESTSVSEHESAYGCLVEGCRSPLAMAMAYKALCDALEIPCLVVSGQRRAVDDENFAWNIIEIEGAYYHMDLSRMDENPMLSFLLSDDDIWGQYDWEREKYPVCDGSLSPESIFPAGNGEGDKQENDNAGANPNPPQQPEPSPPSAEEPSQPEGTEQETPEEKDETE